MPISPVAYRVARYWAEGHRRSDTLTRSYARQVQDHLDHGADPDDLLRIARWMSLEKPDCRDIDLAMHYAGAPLPAAVAVAGYPCRCRGRSTRNGGAPAPALIRQLIRRPAASRAA